MAVPHRVYILSNSYQVVVKLKTKFEVLFSELVFFKKTKIFIFPVVANLLYLKQKKLINFANCYFCRLLNEHVGAPY